MEKVFITGRGLITPLGRSLAENEEALRRGKSGISRCAEFIEQELDSQVAGVTTPEPLSPLLTRRVLRFSPPVASMSVSAVADALQEAGIALEDIPHLRIAVIGGVANANCLEIAKDANLYGESHRLRAVSPFSIPLTMPSSAVAVLSLVFGFRGETYDLSAACSSSALAVMTGARLIESGLYDIVVAGGAEALDYLTAMGFNVIHALSTKYNDVPEKASRPFDRGRDGFVVGSGAAYVILESARSIARRGARAITQVSGSYANSNAIDMVVPDTASSVEVIQGAIEHAGLRASDIGYINTHGTATIVGDPIEMAAIKEVFGSKVAINSTKSQTGHMIGATGAAEVIFTSLMLEKHFISPSINLEDPEPDFSWADLVTSCRTGVTMKHAVTNSFAFGGSNAALVLSDCAN